MNTFLLRCPLLWISIAGLALLFVTYHANALTFYLLTNIAGTWVFMFPMRRVEAIVMSDILAAPGAAFCFIGLGVNKRESSGI